MEALKIASEYPPEGYDVTRVLMHQAFTVPGGSTETSMYAAKGIKMTYTKDGLFCEHKGKGFIVPLANIIVAYL